MSHSAVMHGAPPGLTGVVTGLPPPAAIATLKGAGSCLFGVEEREGEGWADRAAVARVEEAGGEEVIDSEAVGMACMAASGSCCCCCCCPGECI